MGSTLYKMYPQFAELPGHMTRFLAEMREGFERQKMVDFARLTKERKEREDERFNKLFRMEELEQFFKSRLVEADDLTCEQFDRFKTCLWEGAIRGMLLARNEEIQMSLEQALAANTAALEANTAALKAGGGAKPAAAGAGAAATKGVDKPKRTKEEIVAIMGKVKDKFDNDTAIALRNEFGKVTSLKDLVAGKEGDALYDAAAKKLAEAEEAPEEM